jgi:hypothetical protein
MERTGICRSSTIVRGSSCFPGKFEGNSLSALSLDVIDYTARVTDRLYRALLSCSPSARITIGLVILALPMSLFATCGNLPETFGLTIAIGVLLLF